jgi:hypothetical protein
MKNLSIFMISAAILLSISSCKKDEADNKITANKVEMTIDGENWEPQTVKSYESVDYYTVHGKGNNKEIIVQVEKGKTGDIQTDDNNKVTYFDGTTTYTSGNGQSINISANSENGISGEFSVTLSSSKKNAKYDIVIQDFYFSGTNFEDIYFNLTFQGQTYNCPSFVAVTVSVDGEQMIIFSYRHLYNNWNSGGCHIDEGYHGVGTYSSQNYDIGFIHPAPEITWSSRYRNLEGDYVSNINNQVYISRHDDEYIIGNYHAYLYYDHAMNTQEYISAEFKIPFYSSAADLETSKRMMQLQ